MNFKVDLDKKPERFRDHRPGIRLAVVNKSTEIFGKKINYIFYTTLSSRIIAQKRAKPNLTWPKVT